MAGDGEFGVPKPDWWMGSPAETGAPRASVEYDENGNIITPGVAFGTSSDRGVLGETSFQPWNLTEVQVGSGDGTRTRYQRESGSWAWQEGDAESQIKSMSDKQLKKVQQVLAGAGMLSNAVYGYADPNTVKAWRTVLEMSNLRDVNPMIILGRLGSTNRDMMLADMAKAAAEQASSGPTRAPFVGQVTNSEDLRKYFQEAVVGLTGQDRGTVDVDAMVKAYQARSAERPGGSVQRCAWRWCD